MIYLDNNASTRPAPEVLAAMTQCQQNHWANPAARHAAGQAASRLLEQARAQLAQLLNGKPRQVVFTSGATEANVQVLHGLTPRDAGGEPPLLLMSGIEHAAFLKAAQLREAQGLLRLQLLPVDAQGRVSLDAAQALIRPGVQLVSVMAANNETGVLQPIAEIAALCRAAGALLHVDATQIVGRLPFDFTGSGADLASLSAHKLHGPKGIGALLLRENLAWPALLPGAQERGRRGGTANLPAIVGFGVAAQLAGQNLSEAALRQAHLRDAFEAQLAARLPLRVFGADVPRLPNTSCLRIGALHADAVLGRLERGGLIAASGAACSSGGQQASHVLRAMNVAEAEAQGALRFSLSRDTSAEDIAAALQIMGEALAPLAQAA
ncbi:cysteine desulfurase [Solimonas aquatica]|uniref:Cysteine desulfurase n=1 Tax=Solimonas aquatica TaxID=489703 RepID=A0A1H9IPC5_9GAMM|nr:cysteine desulfurase family protein [Solimonas aquatica]SEQ76235.1 cysteine desulfurase [Solimonas aquatica]